jgi:hypothetical protein
MGRGAELRRGGAVCVGDRGAAVTTFGCRGAGRASGRRPVTSTAVSATRPVSPRPPSSTGITTSRKSPRPRTTSSTVPARAVATGIGVSRRQMIVLSRRTRACVCADAGSAWTRSDKLTISMSVRVWVHVTGPTPIRAGSLARRSTLLRIRRHDLAFQDPVQSA